MDTLFDLKTHNGCITVENTKTGGHRTFKVSTVQEGNLKGKRIVALLYGPDNESDYRGFAFVKEDGSISVWSKYRSTSVDVARSQYEVFAHMLMRPDAFEELGAVYHFEGRCRVCNRKLTTPESIQSGIGPVCAGR